MSRPAHSTAPSLGALEAGQDVEQRRLPRSGGTRDPDGRPWGRSEPVDVQHRHDPAGPRLSIGEAEVAHPQLQSHRYARRTVASTIRA